jgi:HSP20 family protein
MSTRVVLRPTISRLHNEVDRLFDAVFPGAMTPQWMSGPRPGTTSMPAVNMWEDEQHIYAEAELPGLTPDQVQVSVLGDALTISGNRQINLPEGATVIRRERGDVSFERSIRLPAEVQSDSVEASLRNGVLTISMAKAPEHQPRRIEVRSGDASGAATS